MTATEFLIGDDLRVRRLGFGAMRLPTEPGTARESAIAVARRAVELGVTLIDTAHLYGWGANEELLAEALYPYPDELLITTKVGVARSGPADEVKLDGRPTRWPGCSTTHRSSSRSRVPPGSATWRRTSPRSTFA